MSGYATVAGNTALGGGSVAAQASAFATHEYAQTARYFTEFPEDIQLLGVSFNTQLGTTGVALQGEVSYRMDAPLQYDDVELLFAALTPFESVVRTVQGRPDPGSCTAADPTLARCGQFRGGNPDRSYGLEQVIQGWGEFDVWQGQMTATKAFPPRLGAPDEGDVRAEGLGIDLREDQPIYIGRFIDRDRPAYRPTRLETE